MKSGAFLAAILAAGVASVGTGASAAEPFYAGKTITFMTGTASGGGSDLNCRIWAEYLPKYIPGNPTIIVKSMPSADNLLATNYVGREAKKDGLTLRCGGFGFATQLAKDPGLQVDFTKFQYVLGNGTPDILVVRTDIAKSREDIFSANGLVLGGSAVESMKDSSARTLLATMGIDHYKYVTGFAGEGAMRAALQQKFINMEPDNLPAFIQVTTPTLIKTDTVIPVYQAGDLDADNHMTMRDPALPDIPTFTEVYAAKYGKPPSGTIWDLAEALGGMQQSATFVLALPDGSPPQALADLRNAVDPLNHDPDYIAAAEKVRGKGAREQSGARIGVLVDNFVHMKPELLAYYNKMLAEGEKQKLPPK